MRSGHPMVTTLWPENILHHPVHSEQAKCGCITSPAVRAVSLPNGQMISRMRVSPLCHPTADMSTIVRMCTPADIFSTTKIRTVRFMQLTDMTAKTVILNASRADPAAQSHPPYHLMVPKWRSSNEFGLSQ